MPGRSTVWAITIAIIISTFAVSSASARRDRAGAGDTGLAGALHELLRVGGRTCMKHHTHYGGSGNFKTKRKARAAAVKSWADFADFEYGGRWARWRLAAGKSMNCRRRSGGWFCDAEARPCRRR